MIEQSFKTRNLSMYVRILAPKTFSAMGRLVPDPTIAISDFQSCVLNWLKEAGCQDIYQLIWPREVGKEVSWKTAPDPVWLHQVSPLFKKIVGVASNLVLSSSKFKGALQKVQCLGFTFFCF